MKKTLNIGTRKSPLALKQVELVVDGLKRKVLDFSLNYDVNVVPIETSGDKFLDDKLTDIGGKGLFTKEIDEALLSGKVDITVHSAKDMPTELPEGIAWECCLARDNPSDYYASAKYPKMEELPEGAVIGTASLRRQLFLQKVRPDAEIKVIRGNIGTRLKKMEDGEYDAIILASAGLARMGLTPAGHELDKQLFIPAPAQGIIAVHCRQEDEHTRDILNHIHHRESFTQARIERDVMQRLDGSCRTPIAAYVTIQKGKFELQAMLGNEKSGELVIDKIVGDIDEYAGMCAQLAERLKAKL